MSSAITPTRSKPRPCDAPPQIRKTEESRDTWDLTKGAPIENFRVWAAAFKQTAPWPLQLKHQRDRATLTAVVKGAGPGGLAAGIELAKAGYKVLVVDLRTENRRQNVITMRPDMLRRLNELDALSDLRDHGKIWEIDSFRVFDELRGLDKEVPPGKMFDDPGYTRPQQISEQRASHLSTIANVETALLRAAKRAGVMIVPQASVRLSHDDTGETKRNRVTLVPRTGPCDAADLGFPDLVVCASGKRDPSLEAELGIAHRSGVDLTAESMRRDDNGRFILRPTLECQHYVVFNLRSRTESGLRTSFAATFRKQCIGNVSAPLARAMATFAGDRVAFNVQIPRGTDPAARDVVGAYVLSQINEGLRRTFNSLEDVQQEFVLEYGSFTNTFPVEPSVAATFVHGGNTVLVGDAGGTSTPGAGIGTGVAVGLDSQNVAQLARVLSARSLAKLQGEGERLKALPTRQDSLGAFQAKKERDTKVWASAGRRLFLTREEAGAF